jgi:hypothetical protein
MSDYMIFVSQTASLLSKHVLSKNHGNNHSSLVANGLQDQLAEAQMA